MYVNICKVNIPQSEYKFASTYIYVSIHAYIYVYIHAHIYMYIFTRIYVCIYSRAYIYTCIYPRIYIYVYIHAYTYILFTANLMWMRKKGPLKRKRNRCRLSRPAKMGWISWMRRPFSTIWLRYVLIACMYVCMDRIYLTPVVRNQLESTWCSRSNFLHCLLGEWAIQHESL